MGPGTGKTMQEIAREIGLSRTTVSLVLQGKGDDYRISKDTQELIHAHVVKSGYKPNFFAKALNRKKSDIIGAVFPDVFESFMGNIIRGLESVLYPKGYSLMISTSNFDQQREKSILDKMVWQGVDGIILVPTMPFRSREVVDGELNRYDGTHIAGLVEKNYPLVVADRLVPGHDCHSVLQDDRNSALKMLRQLYREGYQRTCCVSFDLAASSIAERLAACKEASDEAGVELRHILLQSLKPEEDDLERALDLLFQEQEPPDSWFVTTSGLAEKLIWLLEKRGRRDPVLRFGETPPWTIGKGVPVRDIPHPHREIGSAAAKLLLDLIEKGAQKVPEDRAAGPFRHIICQSSVSL